MLRGSGVFFPFKKCLKTNRNLSHVSAMPWKTKKCCFHRKLLITEKFYSYIIICGRHRRSLRVPWFKTAILGKALISWWLSRAWAFFPRCIVFFLILFPELFQWLVRVLTVRRKERAEKGMWGREAESFEDLNYLFCLTPCPFSLSNSINLGRPQTPGTQGGA